jgi:PTH1 family peptidyl-tRNA hydrolase
MRVEEAMFIVVGLGNPGHEYARTRHNIGYMTLDVLSDRFDIDIRRHNFKAVFGEGHIGGQKVVLAKPETYMNNSGLSVMEIMNFYKCEHSELIVVYDDVDLMLGTIRIRAGGSSGTHNGMKSIIYSLGYDDFPRVRVGIGREGETQNLVGLVLGAPDKEEAAELKEAIGKAADAVELIVLGQLNKAQERFNVKPKKDKPTDEQDEAEQDL